MAFNQNVNRGVKAGEWNVATAGGSETHGEKPARSELGDKADPEDGVEHHLGDTAAHRHALQPLLAGEQHELGTDEV